MTTSQLLLTRLTSSGAPDPAFAGGIPIALPLASGFGMLVHDDGSVVLNGAPPGVSPILMQPSTEQLLRYTAAGAPDTTFGVRRLASTSAAGRRRASSCRRPGGRCSSSAARAEERIFRLVAANGTTAGTRIVNLRFGGGGSSFLVSVRPRPVGSLLQNSFTGQQVVRRPDGSFLVPGGVQVRQPTGEGVGLLDRALRGRVADAVVRAGHRRSAVRASRSRCPCACRGSAPRRRARRHGIRISLKASEVGLARVRITHGGRLIAHSLLPVFGTTRRTLPVELTSYGNTVPAPPSQHPRVDQRRPGATCSRTPRRPPLAGACGRHYGGPVTTGPPPLQGPLLPAPLVVTGHLVTFDEARPEIPDGALYIDRDGVIVAVADGVATRRRRASRMRTASRPDGGRLPGAHRPAQPHRLQLPGAVDRAGPLGAVDRARPVAEGPGLPAVDHVPVNALCSANGKAVLKYVETKAVVGGVTAIQGSSKVGRPFEGWMVRNVEYETFRSGVVRVNQAVFSLKEEKEFREGQAAAWTRATRSSTTCRRAPTRRCARSTTRWARTAASRRGSSGSTARRWATSSSPTGRRAAGRSCGRRSRTSGCTARRPTSPRRGRGGCGSASGSDWAPSGTKNLLGELKVADLWNRVGAGRAVLGRLICAGW